MRLYMLFTPFKQLTNTMCSTAILGVLYVYYSCDPQFRDIVRIRHIMPLSTATAH